MIDPIVYEYFRTGQSDYLKEAMAVLLDWWEFEQANPEATKVGSILFHVSPHTRGTSSSTVDSPWW